MIVLTGCIQGCGIQWRMCCPQDAVHTLRFGENFLTRGRWQTLTDGYIAAVEKHTQPVLSIPPSHRRAHVFCSNSMATRGVSGWVTNTLGLDMLMMQRRMRFRECENTRCSIYIRRCYQLLRLSVCICSMMLIWLSSCIVFFAGYGQCYHLILLASDVLIFRKRFRTRNYLKKLFKQLVAFNNHKCATTNK